MGFPYILRPVLVLLSAISTVLAGVGAPLSPSLYPQFPWCIQTHAAVAGDTCWALEQANGIAHSDFLLINPTLNMVGCDHIAIGSPLCVKAANYVTNWATVTTSTSPPPPPPPPHTTPPPPPPTTIGGTVTIGGTAHPWHVGVDGTTTSWCDSMTKSCVCWGSGPVCAVYHGS